MSISASPGRLSCGSSLLAGGPLCIILGALCFSTTGTVQALAPDGSHPLGIGALRMQIGALALWAWCACRHSLPADAVAGARTRMPDPPLSPQISPRSRGKRGNRCASINESFHLFGKKLSLSVGRQTRLH